MENLRNRIDGNLVNNEKNYLKCRSKPSNRSDKIFDKNFVEMPLDGPVSLILLSFICI